MNNDAKEDGGCKVQFDDQNHLSERMRFDGVHVYGTKRHFFLKKIKGKK